jgi:glutamyl-tRNA reductase
VSLSEATVGVLGGTGPVGRRVAEMVAILGGTACIASRGIEKGEDAVRAVRSRLGRSGESAGLEAVRVSDRAECGELLNRCDVVIACGAAGIELADGETFDRAADSLRVAIDLNAVPPAGIAGIGPMDKATEKNGRIVYGAIGVGGLKMKIHREALRSLFETNDQALEAAEILAIGQRLVG